MGDMIDRDAVLEHLELAEHDAEERDWRSGANEIARLRKYVAALPAAPAEDVRAGALREAAAICDDLIVGYAKHKGAPLALADAKRDILALIPEAKP